jgi:hypothetical protein
VASFSVEILRHACLRQAGKTAHSADDSVELNCVAAQWVLEGDGARPEGGRYITFFGRK